MFKFLPKKREVKVVGIGLDGVPYSLLTDYMEKGYLPCFKKILEQGFNLHQMDASIPDVSSTSWTSFMTGVNPAEHGIYGFMDLRPNSYQLYFPNSGDIHAPTIWDIVGNTTNGKSSTLYNEYKGKLGKPLRSIVLNIPQTYPAIPLNGILTSGFVTPDMKKGTYPESAYRYLQSIEYMPDVDASKATVDREGFLKEISLATKRRAAAFEHFLKEEDWGLFIGVITETDRLHHFFFDAAQDAGHPYHSAFIRFYQEMDKIIGRLYEIFMEMTSGHGLFITMSDHGFTVLKKEVNINTWLRQKGLLKLREQGDFFELIDAGTKAFAMEPARIYINTEGSYPRGIVRESEKHTIIEELKGVLSLLEDETGKPVIRIMYENDGLYRGPLSTKGPALVCLAHDGFDLKGTLKKDEVFSNGHFTGMHTSYDAHCTLPKGIEKSERLHIEHLASIILDFLAK